MAGEHILGWPIAVVRDRRVVAGTTHSRPFQEADPRLIAGSLPRSGYGDLNVEPDPAISGRSRQAGMESSSAGLVVSATKMQPRRSWLPGSPRCRRRTSPKR